MPWVILVPVLLWLFVMTILVVPTAVYSNAWDKLTKAKYRKDRANLQIMLDHLRSFPETWSVNRETASFPSEGSKQIYLNYDSKAHQWNYTLSAFDGSQRPLDGHFGKLFDQELTKLNTQRESQSLLRNFYPELNGTLLLK